MFIWFSIGFIAAIFALYQLANLPDQAWLLPGASLVILAFYFAFRRIGHFLMGAIIGWLVLLCWLFFSAELSDNFIDQPVWVEGKIVSIVEQRSMQNGGLNLQRFEFQLDRISNNSYHQAWWGAKPKIRLSCYRCELAFDSNQSWKLHVKLKPIHGSMNPGAFDYEAWVHYQGLAASGYLVDQAQAQKLHQGWGLRTAFAQRLEPLLAQSDFQGLFSALLYADRQYIDDHQWQVLRKTGTIHLMAISGLHLAMVAWFGWLLGALIWRLPIKRFQFWPVQWFSAIFAVLSVTFYGVLAGFSIPTQRAWIMVMVVIGFLLIRRKTQVWPMLLLAGFLVVLWHPPSVLSQGFWLSFLAVALIFSWLQTPFSKGLKAWQNVMAIQLVLSLGLMPILWWFYQQVPVYSVIANLIAVPFVSFFGLPSLFILALLQLMAPSLAPVFLSVLDPIWAWLWWLLEWIAEWPGGYWSFAPQSLWQVVLLYAVAFSVRYLKPVWLKGVAIVLVCLVWFVPSFDSGLPSGEARISVLDVAQGQAIVIETASRVLVYDTGPSFGERFNGATIAISPYLRKQGWQKIDLLMVSHADQDHAGGTERLIQDWHVDRAVTGQVERLQLPGFESCHTMSNWQWDGVRFEVFSTLDLEPKKHNDFSCVLRVSVGNQAFLVSGDLSAEYEQKLLNRQSQRHLQSAVLVAGHHGSRDSSSPRWLEAVAPDLVLFSAGMNNRFGFPHQQVLSRLEQRQVEHLNTACEGAIQIRLNNQAWWLENRQRRSAKRWFHQFCEQ